MKRISPLQSVDLLSDEILPRIWFATNGLLRPLVELLKEAVDLAYASKHREIDRAILTMAFMNVVWHEAPEDRNPFNATFDTLSLTANGEPYALPERDL